MYQSSSYANLLGSSEPYHAKLKFGSTEIEDDIISVNLSQRSVTDDVFTFGGAISSFVEITMTKPSINIEGQEFILYFSLGNSDWIPMGKFKASHPKTENEITKFDGYDVIYNKMNFGYFSELTYPVDGKKVLDEIATMSGVTINTSSLPSGVVLEQRVVTEDTDLDEEGEEITVTKYVNPFDGYLYNEALGYITQLYGMTAIANRDGNIELRSYKNASVTIDGELYYDNLSVNEKEFSVEKIACGTEDENILYSGSGDDSFVFENPFMTQDRLDAIYNDIKGLRFFPTKISMIGDVRLDVCDIVTITDKEGKSITFPIMTIDHKFDGGMLSEMNSFGKTEESAEGGVVSKGPLSQAMDRQYGDLLVLKELIAGKVSVRYLEAIDAKIENLKADVVDANQITANRIDAIEGYIQSLDVEYLKADQIISDTIVANTGQFTKYLTGVEIAGDLIVANTLQADALILKGDDGLYYKINATSAGLTESQLSEEQYKNAISGTALVAESVTANQIAAHTITSHELNVDQIFADDAVIDRIRTNQVLIGAFKGAKGDQGDSAYTYVKYSTGLKGTDPIYDDWAEGRDYIGIYTGSSPFPPSERNAYSWSRMTGEQGEQGEKGDPGEPGVSTYNAVLTNENHTFSATSDGKARVQSTTTTAYAFEGASEVRLKVISVNGVTPGTVDKSTGITGLNFRVDYTTTTTNIIITFSTTTAFTSTQGSIPIILELYNGARITKNFSYSMVADGANGSDGADGSNAVVYELSLNVAAIKVASTSTTYTPTSITAKGIKTDGNTQSNYSGRFRFEYSTNGGTSYTVAQTSTSDASSATYTIPTNVSGLNMIRVTLYKAGGTTTVLDQQSIPIVKDGTNGTNGTNGTSVSKVTTLHYCKANTTIPSAPTAKVTTNSATTYNAWNIALPNISKSYPYYYRCEQIEYSNGTTGWSTPIVDTSMTNMGKWCHASDTTLIDGGQIYTGSITADKINVNDLRAIKAVIGSWSIGEKYIYANYTGTIVNDEVDESEDEITDTIPSVEETGTYTTLKRDGIVAFAAGSPSYSNTDGANVQITHDGRIRCGWNASTKSYGFSVKSYKEIRLPYKVMSIGYQLAGFNYTQQCHYFGNSKYATRIMAKSRTRTATGDSFAIASPQTIIDSGKWAGNEYCYLRGGADGNGPYLISGTTQKRTTGGGDTVKMTSYGTFNIASGSSHKFKNNINYLTNESKGTTPQGLLKKTKSGVVLLSADGVNSNNSKKKSNGYSPAGSDSSIFDIPVCEYQYNDGYITGVGNFDYNKPILGFIAEDVAEYLPDCATYETETVESIDENGEKQIVENETSTPRSWNERQFIPHLVYAIQKLNERIKELESNNNTI